MDPSLPVHFPFQIFFSIPCFVVEEKAKTHSMDIAHETKLGKGAKKSFLVDLLRPLAELLNPSLLGVQFFA